MEDIIEKIESIIAGDSVTGRVPKTPLLIDTSPDRKMATFFKYKVGASCQSEAFPL